MKTERCGPILPPVCAGLVLAGVAIWSWWDVHALERGLSVAVIPPNLPAERIRRVETDSRAPGPVDDWRETAAWIWGPGDPPGLFDRPPAIHAPPAPPLGVKRPEIDLVATRDLPFRLQLVGHFGEGAGLRGLFESAIGPFLARPGDQLDELGLEIRGIGDGPEQGQEAPVVARVWDRRAGREILLPESVRVPSGTGAALLAPAGFPGEAVEFLAGEILELDGREYRVERIGLAPVSVTLRRLQGGEALEENEELQLEPREEPES